jgi:hypothetical protein
MYKMAIRPDADGYSSTDGEEWISSQLDGGVGRYRLDKLGASKSVGVRWTLNRAQYQYWRAFWRIVGCDKFLCDLVGEDGTGPKEHECHFVPGSVSLPSQAGLIYVQQAQLEVTPLNINPDDDLALLLIYSESGGIPDEWYEALERLVTVTMPEAIGA